MAADWETCVECPGARLSGADSCFVHARGRPGYAAAIETLPNQPDVRGVTLDGHALDELMALICRGDPDHRTVTNARFDDAVFKDEVTVSNTRFGERVSFDGARFERDVIFKDVGFDAASFDRATFEGTTAFRRSAFGDASFRRAAFRGTCEIDADMVQADFSRARFEDTTLLHLRLSWRALFHDVLFRGLVNLRVTGDDADAIQFHDVLCEGQIDAWLEATEVRIRRSRLDRGGQLILSRGRLSIHESRLGSPMLIASPVSADAAFMGRLEGTDLSGTTFSDLQLSEAMFVGSHGLEGLRIEGRLMLRRVGEGSRGTTRRVVIADEDVACGRLSVQHGDPKPSFDDVAAIYRDLRAGREGRKDEPGAADFYYGEMEMRRMAAPAASVERAIIETYRVVSGYGLRASRSIAAFVAMVISATLAYQLFLVHDPPRVLETVLFSLRGTVSFVREPEQLHGMTLGGEFLQLGLRFAGPVLLALTALAIRSRVRR